MFIHFYRVDINGDDLLTVDEISDYIHKRTTIHIDEAMKENYGVFMSIDTNPRNGNYCCFILIC